MHHVVLIKKTVQTIICETIKHLGRKQTITTRAWSKPLWWRYVWITWKLGTTLHKLHKMLQVFLFHPILHLHSKSNPFGEQTPPFLHGENIHPSRRWLLWFIKHCVISQVGSGSDRVGIGIGIEIGIAIGSCWFRAGQIRSKQNSISNFLKRYHFKSYTRSYRRIKDFRHGQANAFHGIIRQFSWYITKSRTLLWFDILYDISYISTSGFCI